VLYLTRKQGYICTIDSKMVTFLKNGNSAFTAPLNDDLTPFLDVTTEQNIPTHHAYAAITGEVPSLMKWHQRFAHRSYDTLKRMINSNSISGFSVNSKAISPCVACVEGKLTRATLTHPAKRATEPLERVVTDVHGPLPIRRRDGSSYWVIFVDQYS
ncbi:hypothetical protein CPB86DRAFT_685509, partial [Serendipita vermifera]